MYDVVMVSSTAQNGNSSSSSTSISSNGKTMINGKEIPSLSKNAEIPKT
jgi:hypothetical protein